MHSRSLIFFCSPVHHCENICVFYYRTEIKLNDNYQYVIALYDMLTFDDSVIFHSKHNLIWSDDVLVLYIQGGRIQIFIRIIQFKKYESFGEKVVKPVQFVQFS